MDLCNSMPEEQRGSVEMDRPLTNESLALFINGLDQHIYENAMIYLVSLADSEYSP